MNYRHVFHAGNFADVFKHAILARILLHLNEKPQPYRVIDTHAGAGRYDLSGTLANKTGEWRDGIGRLTAEDGAVADANNDDMLKPLLDAVAACNPSGTLRIYPGSPAVALSVMRPQDRLTACELEPHAAAALARNLGGDRRAKVIETDGFAALKAYLPPVERRGLVLVDPPFEDRDEFSRLAAATAAAVRKWPTGIYAVWYPVKDATAAAFVKGFHGFEVPKLPPPQILRAELHVASPQSDGLAACGLVLINPPWRLQAELEQLLPDLVRRLRQDKGARYLLEAIT